MKKTLLTSVFMLSVCMDSAEAIRGASSMQVAAGCQKEVEALKADSSDLDKQIEQIRTQIQDLEGLDLERITEPQGKIEFGENSQPQSQYGIWTKGNE